MNKNQRLTPVRLSHLLGFSSVGAVVRGPHYLMVVNDTSTWVDKQGKPSGKPIYYVEQVKSALGIDKELRLPPTATEKESWVEGVCIPAHIFPSWMKCNSCGLLSSRPWYAGNAKFPLRCGSQGCSGKLEQLPWVLVHAKGFLADVPYHFLTHKNTSANCNSDWSESYLRLTQSGRKYYLSCDRCGASNEFYTTAEVPWRGPQQPWVKHSPTAEELEDTPTGSILAVSDPRVHFTERESALVIPPESRIKRGSVVDRLYSSAEKRETLMAAKTPLARKGKFRVLATELGCTAEEISEALEQIEQGYPLYGKNITIGNLLKNEYQALQELIPDLSEDEDFVTRHYTDSWRTLGESLSSRGIDTRVVGLVDAVIGVERLKEIMIMTGFGRLAMDAEEQNIVPPDLIGESEWLPALELYGEGVFISLDQDVLAQWEAQPALIQRVQELKARLAKTAIHFETEVNLSPRFMLLHALSHALIRQFESHAGYPAASLKERIYCSRHDEMAGILIYVAVPDVVGSLGGLAELAVPKRLMPIIAGALEQAQWCSLDPVCSEHDGQGPGLLNKAACHGCILVPETSCSFGNLLLDRVFIKGSEDDGVSSVINFIRS